MITPSVLRSQVCLWVQHCLSANWPVAVVRRSEYVGQRSQLVVSIPFWIPKNGWSFGVCHVWSRNPNVRQGPFFSHHMDIFYLDSIVSTSMWEVQKAVKLESHLVSLYLFSLSLLPPLFGQWHHLPVVHGLQWQENGSLQLSRPPFLTCENLFKATTS